MRMEGIRAVMLAKVLVFFGILVLDSTAHQGHVHPSPSEGRYQPQKEPQEQKCMVIVRRTFLEKDMVIYPCFRPVKGVTPVAAHQSAMGLVCRGYTTIPTTKYIRMSICCPGWYTDDQGRCTKKVDDRGRETSPLQSITNEDNLQQPKRLEDLRKYPSTYENRHFGPMLPDNRPPPRWSPGESAVRRIQAMLEQRMKLIDMIERKMLEREQPPSPPSPVAKLFPKLRKIISVRKTPVSMPPRRQQQQTRVPQIPPQQQRVQQIPKSQQRVPQIPKLHKMPTQKAVPQIPNRTKPKLIITQRKEFVKIPKNPDLAPRKFTHVQISLPNVFPQIPRNRFTPKPIPQIPKVPRQPQRTHHMIPVAPARPVPQMPRMRPHPILRHMPRLRPQPMLRPLPRVQHVVHLPQIPVKMPPVHIQPGPNLGFPAPPPCFAAYLNVVQTCFSRSNVEMPPDHGILNRDYNYQGVCEKKNEINECIKQMIQPCATIQEHILVRTNLKNTLSEIARICHIDKIQGIEDRLSGNTEKVPAQKVIHDHVHSHGDITHRHPHGHPLHDHDRDHAHDHHHHHVMDSAVDPVVEAELKPEDPVTTAAPVSKETATLKGIDFLKPSDEMKPDFKKVVEDIKSDTKKAEAKQTVDDHLHHNVAEAHPHVQHVEEDTIHKYYLPLLIGTAIGVAAIFLLLLALACICCRRRIKKRIYVEKEPEKPKLFDGIYTIGVPPPVYEVNGIPPLSYEEVKGVKITGSPSSVRRHNTENIEYEGNSRKGVVSDI